MRTPTTRTFVIAGIGVALVVAFVGSRFASEAPDGLEKVATEHRLEESTGGAADDRPAGYEVKGIDDPALGKSVAGAIGVVLAFVLALAWSRAARRTGRPASSTQTPQTGEPR